jgi:hypothetical protein
MLTKAFINNPYDAYDQWRTQRIFWSPEFFGGAWIIPQHQDNKVLLRDSENLTTEKAASLVGQFPPRYHDELRDLDTYMARWLAFIDPPKHLRIRKLIKGAFAADVMESFRPQVRATVNSLLDAIIDDGEFDLVGDFAYQLPVRVISMMLGAPERDHPRLVQVMDDLAVFLGNAHPSVEAAQAAQSALCELTDYFRRLVDERRRELGGDLISIMLRAEEDGDVLSEDELHAQCVFFLFAGHETTGNMIRNAMYTLLQNPEQMAKVRASLDLVRPMLEETLRIESPMQYTYRVAKRDFALHGENVQRGDVLVLAFAAANREPAVFECPHKFDVTRTKNPHLTFGYGLHHCIGAPVARLEGEIAYQEILRRMDNIRLTGPEPEWNERFRFRGLKHLYLTFDKIA